MNSKCGKCHADLHEDEWNHWITLTDYSKVEEEAPYKFEYCVCEKCWKLTKEFLETR